MKTSIISVGNSKGIRIPKFVLEESGLGNDVELSVKKGEIRISAATSPVLSESNRMSEKALATDWNRTEEDEAWKSLQ